MNDLVRLVAEITGLCLFGRINALACRLEAIPNRPVDIIIEPVYKERLRREVDRDRTVGF